jgi:hypothetical protein
MRNSNHAIRDALLTLKANGNVKAHNLVISVKASKKLAAIKAKDAYNERLSELKMLIDYARIPSKAEPGCTSRAERECKKLAYLGGEDYQEALSVLRYARVSKEYWEEALFCFGPEQLTVV